MGMVIKLYVENAYDRMDWSYIEDTLKDASSPNKMIEAIMGIILKSKCRLLWNGEVTEYIKPTKGLRHGDPFSLLVFILCMERLSQWIQWKLMVALGGRSRHPEAAH